MPWSRQIHFPFGPNAREEDNETMKSVGHPSVEPTRGETSSYNDEPPLKHPLPRTTVSSPGDSQVSQENEPDQSRRKKIKLSTDNSTVGDQPMIPDTLPSNSDIEELVRTVSMVISAEIMNGDLWFLDSCISHDVVKPKITRTPTHGTELPSTEAPANSAGVGVSPEFKSNIAKAVELFAADFYCPHLISSKSRVGHANCPKSDRVIISTLIAIQEMLIINTMKHFPSSSPQKVHNSVNAILKASANRLAVVLSNFSADTFAQASEGYSSQRADFRFALMEADALSHGVLSDGARCSNGEHAINKASFNCARLKHPLMSNAKACSNNLVHHTHSLPSVPSPNAFTALVMQPDRNTSHNVKWQPSREVEKGT